MDAYGIASAELGTWYRVTVGGIPFEKIWSRLGMQEEPLTLERWAEQIISAEENLKISLSRYPSGKQALEPGAYEETVAEAVLKGLSDLRAVRAEDAEYAETNVYIVFESEEKEYGTLCLGEGGLISCSEVPGTYQAAEGTFPYKEILEILEKG